MEARTTPDAATDAPRPAGYPAALVSGRSAILSFFIPALNGPKHDNEVVAKERPQARVVGKGTRAYPQFYTPAKTKLWEEHVGAHALMQLRSVEVDGDDFTLPIRDVRILAKVRFNLKKPVSYPKSVVHVTKKPDLDNLVKAILDGIVSSGVIDDDNCITDLITMKRYADEEHPHGVEVELTCLPL